MFLNTPMTSPEYMKVHKKYFPTDIIQRYNLNALVHTNDYVYIKIVKGLYGLKQAAILAYDNLSELLKKADYYPIINSFGMWRHRT